MPESDIIRAVLDLARARGYRAERLNSGAAPMGTGRFVRFGFPGCPDVVIFLHDGRTLWVECKTDKGRLNPAQVAFRDFCWERKVPWVLCRRVEDLADWGILV